MYINLYKLMYILDESFLRDTIGKKMFLQLKIGQNDKFFSNKASFSKKYYES